VRSSAVAQTSDISTSVRLTPSGAEVSEGAETTYEVVVDETSGGVGTIDGRIELASSGVGRITDLSFTSESDLQTVSITENGRAVEFKSALMDTEDSGPVTVARVQVSGVTQGSTDVSLTVDTLGNEEGTPYTVGATPDARLTVTNQRDKINLQVTADRTRTEPGSPVEFTVVRADSESRVAATLRVGGTTVETGVDGRATIEITEPMANDAGAVTVVASKLNTTDESFVNDSVSIELGQTGEDTSSGSTGDGLTVRLSPSSERVTQDQRVTFDIVVGGAERGVGAYDLTVDVDDPTAATIVGASVTDSAGLSETRIVKNGSSVEIRAALVDTGQAGPVTVGNVTLEGRMAGETTVELSVTEIGDESGNSYQTGSTPDSALSVATGGDEAVETAESVETSRSEETGDRVETQRSTTVIVALEPFSDGFEKAGLRVDAPSDVTIQSIEPLLISGSQFRVAAGGVGSSAVTVQAVDLSRTVGSFDARRDFLRLTVDGPVSAEEISISTTTLVNDNGEEVSPDRVVVEIRGSGLFPEALPGASAENPPTDLDGDGQYEDIDGDGDKDFDDAIALAFVDSGELTGDQTSALDFDGDDDVDLIDAVILAFR
jgi:hypothetical protein